MLPTIQTELGLSSATAGLLTSLPVFLIGLAAPLAYLAAASIALPRAIALAMLSLVLGIFIRSGAGTAGAAVLFLGTVIIGLSIGVANALILGVIKQMPVASHAALSGLFSLAICLGAAMAAGIAEPMSAWLGHRWDWSMTIWAIPALFGAAMWWPIRVDLGAPPTTKLRSSNLLLNPIAWALCLHMALQSFLSHSTSSWLPSILLLRDVDQTQAGMLLSTMMTAQLVTALSGAWIANRWRNQSGAVAFMYFIALLGFAGCILLEGPWRWISAILLGLGQGGTFSIGAFMVVLRAHSAGVTVRLVAMTQLLGYGLAAPGPWLFGIIRDRTGNWDFSIPVFSLITLLGSGAAIYAGRDRKIYA